MVSFSKICLVAASAGGVFAVPATPHGPLVKFGGLTKVPTKWLATGHAATGATIKAHIGIKQSNIKGLQDKLADIADPASPNYGKWLSTEEIAEYTAPAEADVAAVKSWLASAGISEVTMPTNDWLEFSVPVSKMESLLGSKYQWFVNVETGEKVPRTIEYSVPQNLHSLIDVVTPTTALYHDQGPVKSNAKAAALQISPKFIRNTYNVDYTGTGNTLIATTGFVGYGANHTDYLDFSRRFQPGMKDFTDVSIGSGQNNEDASTFEGNLDTQYAGAIAYPNPAQFIANPPESDNNGFADAMLGLGTYLNSAKNPPSVVSVSYGGEEQHFSSSYLDRVCNEYMKAGAKGISILISSGDSGVGGRNEETCPDGFYATWPASCPYVTTVGGTDFDSSKNEVVADFSKYNNQLTSPGGGYSWHYPAPSYNKNVTAAYASSLSSDLQNNFNATGRGYPDISLISINFQTITNGNGQLILGTSASTPALCGLFGLLNDYRKTKGKPALGFLNPLIYSDKYKRAFRDITIGSNKGCDSDGFPAQDGWDAASGVGSLDFGKLRSLL
ncbi:hypothetical protein NLG97_g7732 [Lecanicillium saksenae]|uniref:Uncharacterized protein n=1 Tax=Lecanicillium saksenae TaxID=468837 RepID=A0ACC1QLI6_9HYPO|nr:hypothetical protein NLG97_g7732 [Lecanicillium saksenae]